MSSNQFRYLPLVNEESMNMEEQQRTGTRRSVRARGGDGGGGVTSANNSVHVVVDDNYRKKNSKKRFPKLAELLQKGNFFKRLSFLRWRSTSRVRNQYFKQQLYNRLLYMVCMPNVLKINDAKFKTIRKTFYFISLMDSSVTLSVYDILFPYTVNYDYDSQTIFSIQ